MITYIFPPRNINFLYGYRTSGSMKTKERWDFAQKYSALLMLKLGIGLMLLSVFGLFFSFSKIVDMTAALFIDCAILVVLFIRTEKELKQRFPD